MYFKLEYILRELLLDFRNTDSIDFDIGGSHRIVVNLHQPTAEMTTMGYKPDTLICTATSDREPSDRVRTMFDQLAADILPTGSSTYETLTFRAEPGQSLHQHVPSRAVLPQPFVSFTDDVEQELREYALQAVRLLRWRYALPGDHNPVQASAGLHWSADAQQWHRMPVDLHARLSDTGFWQPSIERIQELITLISNGVAEPAAHELFREAWQQQHANPRSSLFLAIAAAEIGVKQCTAMLVPEVRWLSENAPSPPLADMLEHHLPHLPAKQTFKGQVLPLPKDLRATIRNGVGKRNRLIHSVTSRIDADELEKLLLAVRDLLWLLDYYCGFTWALRHIRREVRESLESGNA